MTLSVLAGFQKSTALKEPLDNLRASLFLRIKRSALILNKIKEFKLNELKGRMLY